MVRRKGCVSIPSGDDLSRNERAFVKLIRSSRFRERKAKIRSLQIDLVDEATSQKRKLKTRELASMLDEMEADYKSQLLAFKVANGVILAPTALILTYLGVFSGYSLPLLGAITLSQIGAEVAAQKENLRHYRILDTFNRLDLTVIDRTKRLCSASM